MIILADSMKEVENRARSLLLEIVDNVRSGALAQIPQSSTVLLSSQVTSSEDPDINICGSHNGF